MKTASTWANDAHASTLLDLAAHYHPLQVLQYGEAIADKPYAKEIIESIARANPGGAIEYAGHYIEQPYAEEIIRAAAVRVPKALLEHAGFIIDQPYGETLIRKAAKDEPQDAFKFAKNYIEQPYAESILREAATKPHTYPLRDVDQFIDRPYTEEIIRIAAERDPTSALHNAKSFWDRAYGESVLREAANREPVAAIINLPEQIVAASSAATPEYIHDIIKKTSVEFPEAVISAVVNGNFDRHLFSLAYGNDLVQQALLHAPDLLILHADSVSNNRYIPQGDALVRDAALLNPQLVVSEYRHLTNPSFLDIILEPILRDNNSLAARNIFWNHLSHSHDISIWEAVGLTNPEEEYKLSPAFIEEYLSFLITGKSSDSVNGAPELKYLNYWESEPNERLDQSRRAVYDWLPGIRDEPYYESISHLIATHDPRAILYGKMDLPNMAASRETAAKSMIQMDPEYILRLPDDLVNRPFAVTIARNALLQLAESDPKRILYEFNAPHTASHKAEILPLAAKRLLEADPGALFKHRISIYKNSWSGPLLQEAAARAPEAVFSEAEPATIPSRNRDNYRQRYKLQELKPYVEIAAQANPEMALSFARENITHPLAAIAFVTGVAQSTRNLLSRPTDKKLSSAPDSAGLSEMPIPNHLLSAHEAMKSGVSNGIGVAMGAYGLYKKFGDKNSEYNQDMRSGDAQRQVNALTGASIDITNIGFSAVSTAADIQTLRESKAAAKAIKANSTGSALQQTVDVATHTVDDATKAAGDAAATTNSAAKAANAPRVKEVVKVAEDVADEIAKASAETLDEGAKVAEGASKAITKGAALRLGGKIAGRAAIPIALVAGTYEGYQGIHSGDRERTAGAIGSTAGGIVGGILAGMAVGAAAGVLAGGTAGSVVPGVGTIAVGVVAGIGGGIAGAFIGEAGSKKLLSSAIGMVTGVDGKFKEAMKGLDPRLLPFLDQNGDKKRDVEDIHTILKRAGLDSIEKLDTNHDKKLSSAELARALNGTLIDKELTERLGEFNAKGLNKTLGDKKGQLTLAELKSALPKGFDLLSLDKNHNGDISSKEITDALQLNRAPTPPTPPSAARIPNARQ